MNVLSLFDGISCGQIALGNLGIKPIKYYASEVDKHAIQVTQSNYPNTIQLGDVTNWKAWDIDWKSINLLTAGFPCQAWSIAGNKLGTDDPRGELAITLLNIFNHIRNLNPNLKFLFENVKMKKEHLEYLNTLFGVNPILIDSINFSAQSRKRYYWTNLHMGEIKPLSINLADILEDDPSIGLFLSKERSDYVLKLASMNNKDRKLAYSNKISLDDVNIPILPSVGDFIYNHHLGQNGTLFKKYAATIVCAGRHHCVAKLDGELRIRRLSVIECERLQTIPDDYTSSISDSNRYKSIGNGWTVNVITYIFNVKHVI